MEKIKIKINTIQTVDDAGNEDRIELISEATLDTKADHFIVNYDESDITETEVNKTRLKIYKNKMIMSKIGQFSSKMEFDEGNNLSNIYQTPYGSFNIGYNTLIYNNLLNEKGRGIVYVEYNVSFGKSGDNYNKLRIEII